MYGVHTSGDMGYIITTNIIIRVCTRIVHVLYNTTFTRRHKLHNYIHRTAERIISCTGENSLICLLPMYVHTYIQTNFSLLLQSMYTPHRCIHTLIRVVKGLNN